ncbi:polysaccharide deacetylase family protein [Glycomyces niveus]|jgi:peptidoglycan/xylan/chitin deacetylase (PgdA/CDA1 family)|uniref:Polysaccharide deacetylase family protein n=1 Tax=Glycomyces niveus TaxID=2820287 RepID=A0ABS3UBB9_9ACTN|nr:polysaccharide deacetylase family protein [Glycomyces sp. NEAU-S30]MBO3735063.1 polysaccharide deacetylase family protein [Glycomyces sp. NEAU-S30]
MKHLRLIVTAAAAIIGSLLVVTPANAQETVQETVQADDPWNGTIFLTFDDGPGGANTDQILEVLAANNAKATFFMIGQNAQRDPARVQAVLDAGHALGNHTWDHPDMTTLTRAQMDSQIGRSQTLLESHGAEVNCFRPPYGAYNSTVDAATTAAGLKRQMWNEDTRDWARPGVDAIVNVLLGATPGDVVLMHDGGGDRSQTVAALEIALPQLIEKGYNFGITPKCSPTP